MAHSCILGAASPALCQQMLQLSSNTRSADVQLPYLHLRSLIDFIYTGTWTLAECSVEEMQYAAEMFEITLGDFRMEPGGPTFAMPVKTEVTDPDTADQAEAVDSVAEEGDEIVNEADADSLHHKEQQSEPNPGNCNAETGTESGTELGMPSPKRRIRNRIKKTPGSKQGSRDEGNDPPMKKEVLEDGEGDFGAMPFHQCDMCWQKFNIVLELYEHKKTHKEAKRYRCRYCDKRFQRSHHRLRHQTIHTGDKQPLYQCKFCSKRFPSGEERSKHQEEHKVDRPYKCSFCAKGFKNTSALRSHEMSLHTVHAYKCEVCPQTCATISQLRKHQLTHSITEKKYVCKTCGAKFKYIHNLNEHMRKHRDDKPYKCKHCEKSFLSRTAWVEHERTHTGEQPHICEHCGLAFNRAQAYRQHLRIHTGEKPYKCRHCDKSFRKLDTKRMHENTHTGLKPYKCRTCDKSFANSNTRKVHERIHLKVKPYVCPICNGCFTRKDNLMTHQQRIHHLRDSDVAAEMIKDENVMMDVAEAEENITEVQTEHVSVNQGMEADGYTFVVKPETLPSSCLVIQRTDAETHKLVTAPEEQMAGDCMHVLYDGFGSGDVQVEEIIDSVNIVEHIEEVVVAEQE